MTDGNDAAAQDVPGVEPIELRVFGGPNVYFTRPAVELVLDVAALLRAEAGVLAGLGRPVSPTLARPGAAGSDARWRYVARLVASLTRAVAAGAGAPRVPVLGRPGPEPGQVVVAFPWRHRNRAVALAGAVAAGVARLPADDLGRMVTDAARRVRAIADGPPPATPQPTIPVVAVTGTTGAATTAGLVAHLGRRAGRVVGRSGAGGVQVDGITVAAGDRSGPDGAALVFADPRVDLAVLEIAPAGILRGGLGTAHTDVSVVTDVDPTALGRHGLRTLDQLAEVEATVVRVTKPDGWLVLDADDRGVRRMRLLSRARTWLFSLDPDSPYLDEALEAGGRGVTVLGGWVAVLEHGLEPDLLVPVADLPLAAAGPAALGLTSVLAGVAAALAAGLSRAAVVAGLPDYLPE